MGIAMSDDYMTMESELYYKAKTMMMNNFIGTKNQGLLFMPIKNWDGKDKTFESVINGWSNSDYAKNQENQRSISSMSFLRRMSHLIRCYAQNYKYWSVTEA